MTILCYHDVQPGWTSPMAVDPQSFAEHCAWLSSRKTVLPLREAIHRLDRSGRLPRGQAAITFDDGFLGLSNHALPVLVRYRLPATIFLVAETLTEAGRPVDWVDTPPAGGLTTLSREQVLEMQEAGVSFESHSFAHLDLTRLGFRDCVRDLKDSREVLESLLGRSVRLLAYPRGRHDEDVRAAASRAGYTNAFTLPEGKERPGPYAIPRVGIFGGNGVASVRLKSARPYLPVRTGRAYRYTHHLRRLLAGAAGPSHPGPTST